MTTLHVQAPDGKTLNIPVPDGTDPSKYDSIVDDVMKDYTANNPGTPEGPGMLKSGALGLMSGVPGAEAAVSGVESALDPKTTYAQAHQGLEDQKDAAWNAHPVAYGAGKGAGFVGTALAAPVAEGLGGAAAIGAGVGALSGADAASNVSDIPGAALKGAGTGALVGGAGNLVGKAVSAAPGAAKSVLASLGSETTPSDISEYLARSGAINGSMTREEISQKLADTASQLGKETSVLNEKALGTLNPDNAPLTAAPQYGPSSTTSIAQPGSGGVPRLGVNLLGSSDNTAETGGPTSTVFSSGGRPVSDSINPASVPIDTLDPVFAQLRQQFTQSGVAKSGASQSALNALDAQEQTIRDIAARNGGKISETDLKSQISELQGIARNAFGDSSDVATSKGALRNLSGALNGVLKDANPAYGAAMKPVAERTGLLSDLSDQFKLEQGDNGYTPTDATYGKIGNVTKEGKSEGANLLGKVKDLTGEDLMQQVHDAGVADRFNAPGAGGALKTLAASMGFGLGKMTGVPYGGIGGAAAGRFGVEGMAGAQSAKGILDAYMAVRNNPVAGAAGSALQKFGPILAKAAQTGGNELAATHFVLATSNPEYQQLVEDHSGNNAQSDGSNGYHP